MRTIYKYELSIVNEQTLEIPGYAKLLDVQMQNGTPCIWALVDTTEAKRSRIIQIFGTGHNTEKAGTYIATFQTGPLVFHVFEK